MPEKIKGIGDGKALIPHLFSDSLSGFIRNIFQPLLTGGLVASTLYLLFMKIDVPDWLISLTSAAVGFWLKDQVKEST